MPLPPSVISAPLPPPLAGAMALRQQLPLRDQVPNTQHALLHIAPRHELVPRMVERDRIFSKLSGIRPRCPSADGARLNLPLQRFVRELA